MAKLLKRMAITPDNLIDVGDPFEAENTISARKWKQMQSAWKVLNDCANGVVAIGEPPLPDNDLAPRRLFVRPDPASAAGVAATTLSQFDFAQAISYSLLAWRRLLSSQGRSWLTDQLESQFQNIRFRGIVTQQLRSALGDSAPGVRSRALQLLGEGLGDLQDVGLLLDLSELPPEELSDDERRETLNAIKEISGAALEL